MKIVNGLRFVLLYSGYQFRFPPKVPPASLRSFLIAVYIPFLCDFLGVGGHTADLFLSRKKCAGSPFLGWPQNGRLLFRLFSHESRSPQPWCGILLSFMSRLNRRIRPRGMLESAPFLGSCFPLQGRWLSQCYGRSQPWLKRLSNLYLAIEIVLTDIWF